MLCREVLVIIYRQREVDVKTEKEMRRKLREEKRKAKILQKLEITGADEINEKIANEEKKLLKVQRKLEAIRLVEELFRRIKDKNPGNMRLYDGLPNPGYDELKKFKNTSELEVLTQREKLHHALKGRVMLKTILSDKGRPRRNSSSSSDSDLSLDEVLPSRGRPKSPVVEKYPELLYNSNWLGFQYPFPGAYPELMDPYGLRGFMPRGRAPFPRLPMLAGPSRGMNFGGGRRRPMRNRGGYRGGGRGRQYPQEMTEEYQFFDDLDNRRGRSYSRERSWDRSKDRMRSRDRSRGRTKDRSRSRSRRRYSKSYSRSRSRSRSRRRSRSRSHRSSRSKSRSRARTRRSHSRDRSRSRSSKRSSRRKHRDTSESRSRHRSRSRSGSKSKENDKCKTPENERSGSVDSSKFMTPKQLSLQKSERRERSKSWSLPKEGEPQRRSWSKSPERKM
ncbi:unnamed protein product [Acanthoscelides obtectus]|uniref:Uncharacterized protein n=1 Tax=Acanthoscelides obtectus TaxID=200917 RepID=A0A9P0JJW7_ACAOB|nr:unnamed protein product [Acanthoscelides obtectus]CAK1665617.1 hypothetical protein AOBTE_LOCUS24901 [Acanthoscelides obtectus]